MSAVFKLQSHFKSSSLVTLLKRGQQTQIKAKKQLVPKPSDLIPVFQKAINFNTRTALRDSLGCYSYANLILGAKEVATDIKRKLLGKSNGQVLFLCPNNANYIVAQWGIWMAGHTAVPVSVHHPPTLLEYYARDSNSQLIVTTSEHADTMKKVADSCSKPLYVLSDELHKNLCDMIPNMRSDLEDLQPPTTYLDKNAMILYTSGTTGQPKGVVLTHKNICVQVSTLVDAWKWTPDDIILHVLPLHHVHGIVNALLCPFHVGAKCNMLPKFDSNEVWTWLLGINTSPDHRKLTVFMAVPTIYAKLMDEYERVFKNDPKITDYIKTSLKSKMRLMVSGSAPLAVPLYNKWLEITGHKLLERYGMTEIGMCLSQEYDSERRPGYVGIPLPGVSVMLGQKKESGDGYVSQMECSYKNNNLLVKVSRDIDLKDDPIGELLVKGDSVFKEYYNRPEVTKNEFTTDKWFKTGDICQYSRQDKLFKILGRANVDIIKTGGYKVSAIELETKLLAHPDIVECAVVGLDDEKWEQKVAAVIVLKPETKLTLDTLKLWAKDEMASYAIPQVLKVVESIPRNAMGKVNKQELVKNVF